jgi:hypothetical protein
MDLDLGADQKRIYYGSRFGTLLLLPNAERRRLRTYMHVSLTPRTLLSYTLKSSVADPDPVRS